MMIGQEADLASTHAHNHRQAAGHVLRVDRCDQSNQVGWVDLVADLDAQRIADATQELQVGRVQLPCALSAP